MIYIVHGDNTAKSRALILNQQKKLGILNKLTLDIIQTSPTGLIENCASSSLFGEKPFVVLDITNYGRMNLDEYVRALSKVNKDSTVIVYSAKALPKTNAVIKAALELTAKVIENTDFVDANVFKFTDQLFSKNRQQTYKEFGKLIQADYDFFYIFSMILYGLRSVAKVVWGAPSVSKLKPFQVDKLKTQSLKFTSEGLKNAFGELYALEKKAKTGITDPETMAVMSIEKVLNA